MMEIKTINRWEKEIAKIMNKDIGITKSTKKVICKELADYFEKERIKAKKVER